eukprot:scaffold144448_cov34-Prasinocladus_malaysianus.AAC.2
MPQALRDDARSHFAVLAESSLHERARRFGLMAPCGLMMRRRSRSCSSPGRARRRRRPRVGRAARSTLNEGST